MEQTKITDRFAYLTKVFFVTTCMVLGCSGSGTLGCSGRDGGGEPTVDSDLLGIYQVDKYQGSGDGCGPLMDLDGASRIVLFSTPSETDPKQAILVGQFCGSVENCRAAAKDPPGGRQLCLLRR